MEPMICVILIIVVIAIAALEEEISARKSNKVYSQNQILMKLNESVIF